MKNEALGLATSVKDLAEQLQREFMEIGLPDFFELAKIEDPYLKSHIILKSAVEAAYLTLEGIKIGDPYIQEKKDFCRVEMADFYILQSRKREKAEQFIKKFREETNSSENISKMKEIAKKLEKLGGAVESFEGKLREIISKIGSGHYLKGFCDGCKHLFT